MTQVQREPPVQIRPRSTALAPFVTSLGFFESELEPRRERVLPSGHVSLMVNLHEDEFRSYHGPDYASVRRTRGAAFTGPQARHTVIDIEEQRCLVYVSFRLGGAAAFFDAPLDETTDELVDLEDLWGDATQWRSASASFRPEPSTRRFRSSRLTPRPPRIGA